MNNKEYSIDYIKQLLLSLDFINHKDINNQYFTNEKYFIYYHNDFKEDDVIFIATSGKGFSIGHSIKEAMELIHTNFKNELRILKIKSLLND